jgi:hypothetical protein
MLEELEASRNKKNLGISNSRNKEESCQCQKLKDTRKDLWQEGIVISMSSIMRIPLHQCENEHGKDFDLMCNQFWVAVTPT